MHSRLDDCREARGASGGSERRLVAPLRAQRAARWSPGGRLRAQRRCRLGHVVKAHESRLRLRRRRAARVELHRRQVDVGALERLRLRDGAAAQQSGRHLSHSRCGSRRRTKQQAEAGRRLSAQRVGAAAARRSGGAVALRLVRQREAAARLVALLIRMTRLTDAHLKHLRWSVCAV